MNIPGDLSNLMKEAQKMQQELKKAQEKLQAMRVTGTAGTDDKTVIVEMAGNHDVVKINISDSLYEEESKSMLQDLIVAAINQAVRAVEKMTYTEMEKLTNGMKRPSKDDV